VLLKASNGRIDLAGPDRARWLDTDPMRQVAHVAGLALVGELPSPRPTAAGAAELSKDLAHVSTVGA
jgi:hypothetical protein